LPAASFITIGAKSTISLLIRVAFVKSQAEFLSNLGNPCSYARVKFLMELTVGRSKSLFTKVLTPLSKP